MYHQGIPLLEHSSPEQRARAYSKIHTCPSHKCNQEHSPQPPHPTYLHPAQSLLQHFLVRAAFHATEAVVAYKMMSTALSENCQNHVTVVLHRTQALFYEVRDQPCGLFPKALNCVTQWDEQAHIITEAERLLSSP